ncbi:hypothetical protein ACRAWD_01075 [Caulobacter segnis]
MARRGRRTAGQTPTRKGFGSRPTAQGTPPLPTAAQRELRGEVLVGLCHKDGVCRDIVAFPWPPAGRRPKKNSQSAEPLLDPEKPVRPRRRTSARSAVDGDVSGRPSGNARRLVTPLPPPGHATLGRNEARQQDLPMTPHD